MKERAMRALLIVTLGAAAMPGVAGELTLEAFDQAVKALEVPDPASDADPLSLNAALVSSNPEVGDVVIAVLKVRMLPTWYIYEDVPASQPFIETEWVLEAGPELEIVDDWAGPPSTPHESLAKTRVHASGIEGIVFFREMEVLSTGTSKTKVEVGLRYQICNAEYCLPPTTKTKELELDLSDG